MAKPKEMATEKEEKDDEKNLEKTLAEDRGAGMISEYSRQMLALS